MENNSHISSHRKAFTLAELLLSLTIMGIIASYTIPPLMINVSNTVNYVKLRNAYSVFQQAFNLLKAGDENNIVSIFQNDTTTNHGNGNALNSFLTKLNYTKNCGTGTGCWYDTPLYYLDGSTETATPDTTWNAQYEKAILIDGSIVLIYVNSITCTYDPGGGVVPPLQNNICALLYFDVNGAKGPNKIGRDFFRFYITKTGIYPYGTFGDGRNCNISTNGNGCAFKVISEGAINY